VDHETQQPGDSPPSPSDEQARPTPDMEAETPTAGAVPPGYDWPTHGGYLGCLIGGVFAFLLAAFLGSTLLGLLISIGTFNNAGIIPKLLATVAVIVIFLACMVGIGRIGWLLGRRFYRKYPREELSWGEDDLALSASTAEHPAQAPDVQ
jgi:hypothetical protein